MAILRLTQEIDRPVQDVFAIVIQGGDFANWNPTITASRQLTPDPIGEGTRFEWKLRGFGNVEQELQEFEPNRRVRIVPHHRSLAGGHRFSFTDLGSRTRIEHELEMVPKGVFKVMSPFMTSAGRKNLQATVDALDARLRQG
ncbi:MAG TPA: SRPBCC family protein [Actinomycetota bacterium]|nr:SRPBCC family protein [Actinomycetota bacterium]